MELRILKTDSWVTDKNELTDKAKHLLEEMDAFYGTKVKKHRRLSLGADALQYINRYREMFPKGELPSGVPARVNYKELEKKFTWFFNTYTFDWETVLKATHNYIELYEGRGYQYMQNSSYFISRQDHQKNITSTLATFCDQVIEESIEEPELAESKFNVI